jgi:hypothetical protein
MGKRFKRKMKQLHLFLEPNFAKPNKDMKVKNSLLLKKTFFFLLLPILPLVILAQTKSSSTINSISKNIKTNQLYPINENGQFGYINKLGSIVIKPQFEDGKDFKDGYAIIKISGKYGVIDSKGKIIVNPIYVDIQSFCEGLARIKMNGLYGFIDSKGQIKIKPQFEYAFDFFGGLAKIKISGKFGLINNKGEIICNPMFDEISEFHDGLAKVSYNYNYGYINQKGKIVIEPKFKSASNFSEGLALVSDSWNQVSGFGYIDKTGNFIMKPQFGSGTSEFKEGIACARLGEQYGYINKSGKFIIQPQFNFASPFFEGLAWVSYSENGGGIFATDAKFGCIDKTGKFIINPGKYFWPSGFSEGLAPVKFLELGKITDYGYVDKFGKIVIESRFTVAQSFHNGWAYVMLDNNGGIINKNGQFIQGEIVGELIRIWEKGIIYYRDKKLNWIWRPS